jgi:hypothetical protein
MNTINLTVRPTAHPSIVFLTVTVSSATSAANQLRASVYCTGYSLVFTQIQSNYKEIMSNTLRNDCTPAAVTLSRREPVFTARE